MIAFIGLLVNPALEAGIKVPPVDVVEDATKFKGEDFPHWMVYVTMQLGSPMPSPTSHWENAKLVAGIPDDQIRCVTPKQLYKMGFQSGNSRP